MTEARTEQVQSPEQPSPVENAFLTWLMGHPEEQVGHDPTMLGDDVGHLDALIRHLIGSFWQIDLFGGVPA